MMVETALIALVTVLVVHTWHVHKVLERLETLYMALISLAGEYISSLYNLAHTQLEQYAAAFQVPQTDDNGRYA